MPTPSLGFVKDNIAPERAVLARVFSIACDCIVSAAAALIAAETARPPARTTVWTSTNSGGVADQVSVNDVTDENKAATQA
jgi:hypothetical protein